MKPNINSVDVHPQVSNNGHPVDGVLVGAGSLRPKKVKVPEWVLVHQRCGLPSLLWLLGIHCSIFVTRIK